MIERLYLDMDGVLCDFDAQCDRYGCRKAPGKSPSAIDWDIPKKVGPEWWATMDWTDGGEAFFKSCRQVCAERGIEMGILTAIEIPAGIRGMTSDNIISANKSNHNMMTMKVPIVL